MYVKLIEIESLIWLFILILLTKNKINNVFFNLYTDQKNSLQITITIIFRWCWWIDYPIQIFFIHSKFPEQKKLLKTQHFLH